MYTCHIADMGRCKNATLLGSSLESVRGCLGKVELDLHTLVWTLGAAFPITSLENRLKYPLCGSRRVSIIFDLPKEPNAMRIAGMPSR